MPKYDQIVKKYTDQIAKIDDDIQDAAQELVKLKRDLAQHEKNKSAKKDYNASAHKAANERRIKLEIEEKRLANEKKKISAQLVQFKQGLEDFPERRTDRHDANIEEHAKDVFIEVQAFEKKLGDTSKQLKAEIDKQQKAIKKLMDEGMKADEKRQALSEKGKDAEAQKQLEIFNKAQQQLPRMNAKLKLLEQRYEFYTEEKAKIAQMLKDGKITDAEYKLYKKSLKESMRA